jgi:hypothetical protein
MEDGCADAVRRCEGAAICSLCHRTAERDPRRFNTTEKKMNEEKALEDQIAQDAWRAKRLETKNLPRNGKTSGCHAEPMQPHASPSKQRCAGAPGGDDPDPYASGTALEPFDRIGRKRRRMMGGKKSNGVHWPFWRLKNDFGHLPVEERPKIRKRLTFAGEAGGVLDTIHGCPSGCSQLYEIIEDGVERDGEMVDSRNLEKAGDERLY